MGQNQDEYLAGVVGISNSEVELGGQLEGGGSRKKGLPRVLEWTHRSV